MDIASWIPTMIRDGMKDARRAADSTDTTFAVLFKIHTWDGFIVRQLDRLRKIVDDEHIFLVIDNTRSCLSPDIDLKIFSIDLKMIQDYGLLLFPKENLLWYNNDYPLYLFQKAHPDFDYIITYEYDCVVRLPVVDMIAFVHSRGLDFLGEEIRTPAETWHWRPSITPHYPSDLPFAGRLACFSIFSRRFVDILAAKRLAHSVTLRETAGHADANGIPLWPFGEGLIGAELALNALPNARLSDLGSSRHYDWAPPFHEDSLKHIDSSFVHPVLDEPRFLASITSKLGWKLRDIFIDGTPMQAWFAGMRFTIAIPVLFRLFLRARDWKSVMDLSIYAGRRVVSRILS